MESKKLEQKNAPAELDGDMLAMVSGGDLSTDVPQQTGGFLTDFLGTYEAGETESENSINQMISDLGSESAMNLR